MKYIPVKGLTSPVSNIAFGTAHCTLEEEELTHALLDYYVSLGGNYIDTARFYGRGSGIQHTEELLGRWLAKGDNRSKVFIQSKCCNPYMSAKLEMFEEMPRVGKTFMYDDILFSRDHLGVDTIDLYLTHRDNPHVPVEEIVDTFEEFMVRGWIQAYGMSNWTMERFIEAYEYAKRMGYQGPSVFSPFFSLIKLDRPWFYRIPPFAAESIEWFTAHKDVVVSAWAPQGRGFFEDFPQYDPKTAKKHVQLAVLTEENLERKQRVQNLATQKQLLPQQISLSYVLGQDANMVGICGPRSRSDVDNVMAATNITLSKEEIAYLTLKQNCLSQ